MTRNRNLLRVAILAGIAGAALQTPAAIAAEGGHGVYMLGFGGPGAGMLPPPGVFFSTAAYYYEGANQANRPFPLQGRTVAGVDAKAQVLLPSLSWVTPWEFFGGRLAFGALLPIGGPKVDAGATLTAPFLANPTSAERRGSIFTVGDPSAGASLGWKSGNFHWKVGVTGYFPVGDYRKGALANISNNRLSADLNGGVTWLDPDIGLEVSLAGGLTFNSTNRATRYRTGNELHLDWAVIQNFSKEFSAGLIGYHYQQTTGDSGAGATLGQFKGRATALGGTVGYNFKIGELPISARVKVFKEFNVKNRLEGRGGFLTISMPLYVAR